jgi:glycosyltransferase involved in cell wall biosynthesis
MRILFLTQILPFPPDAGPRVKSWHVIRSLAAQGHEVILLSFIRPEEECHLEAVRRVCADVRVVPSHRSRPADALYGLRSLVSGRPFLIERDDQAEMRRLVNEKVATGAVDVIHADQLTMAQYGLDAPHPAAGGRPALLFDAHNAVWIIFERLRHTARAPWRPFLALEARRVKRYEGMVVRRYDATLAVTEEDRQALLMAAGNGSAAQPSVTVAPIAIDVACLPLAPPTDSQNILTLGTLHYPPNADGIRWFVTQVFPLVQQQSEATLTIVGKNPPPDIVQAARRCPDVVDVTGYVTDLEPFLAQAALVVVPVRVGGGMRVRILEAFARSLPVVTTTVGLEGIEARPGEDVLVADTPADFAAAVIRLLSDPELRRRLGENGRRLVQAHYDWHTALQPMADLYQVLGADRDNSWPWLATPVNGAGRG